MATTEDVCNNERNNISIILPSNCPNNSQTSSTINTPIAISNNNEMPTSTLPAQQFTPSLLPTASPSNNTSKAPTEDIPTTISLANSICFNQSSFITVTCEERSSPPLPPSPPPPFLQINHEGCNDGYNSLLPPPTSTADLSHPSTGFISPILSSYIGSSPPSPLIFSPLLIPMCSLPPIISPLDEDDRGKVCPLNNFILKPPINPDGPSTISEWTSSVFSHTVKRREVNLSELSSGELIGDNDPHHFALFSKADGGVKSSTGDIARVVNCEDGVSIIKKDDDDQKDESCVFNKMISSREEKVGDFEINCFKSSPHLIGDSENRLQATTDTDHVSDLFEADPDSPSPEPLILTNDIYAKHSVAIAPSFLAAKLSEAQIETHVCNELMKNDTIEKQLHIEATEKESEQESFVWINDTTEDDEFDYESSAARKLNDSVSDERSVVKLCSNHQTEGVERSSSDMETLDNSIHPQLEDISTPFEPLTHVVDVSCPPLINQSMSLSTFDDPCSSLQTTVTTANVNECHSPLPLPTSISSSPSPIDPPDCHIKSPGNYHMNDSSNEAKKSPSEKHEETIEGPAIDSLDGCSSTSHSPSVIQTMSTSAESRSSQTKAPILTPSILNNCEISPKASRSRSVIQSLRNGMSRKSSKHASSRSPQKPNLTAQHVSQLPPRNDPFECPKDLKILCRLIAAHQRYPQKGSSVSFFIDGTTHSFRVLLNVDIGHNVRCLILERHISSMETPFRVRVQKSEVVFAFNWFSPTGLWDYLSLGLKLLANTQGVDKEYGMLGDFYLKQANDFYTHPSVREILQELKLGFIPKEFTEAQQKAYKKLSSGSVDSHKYSSDDSHRSYTSQTFYGEPFLLEEASVSPPVQSGSLAFSTAVEDLYNAAEVGLHKKLIHADKITLTGFSMGASIAHAFALLLKDKKNMPQAIRCVGFGSPRPGNSLFTAWFKRHLTTDSMNVVLASEEFLDNPDLPVEGLDTELQCTSQKEEDQTEKNDSMYKDICRCTDEVPICSALRMGNVRKAAFTSSTPVSTTCSSQSSDSYYQPTSSPSISLSTTTTTTTTAATSSLSATTTATTPTSPSNNESHLSYSSILTSSASLTDMIYGPRVTLYDPVSRTPSTYKGFDIQPNLHIILQQKKGLISQMSEHEKQRLRHLDVTESSKTNTFNTIFNLAMRGSPFSPEFSRGWDKLHSVLKYYEALYQDG